MFEKTLISLFFMILGYVFKKANILKKEDGEILITLLMNVMIPAMLFGIFAKNEIQTTLVVLPLVGFIVDAGLLAAGYVMARLLFTAQKTREAATICSTTLEGGLVGYSFVLATIGTSGLLPMVAMDMGNALFSMIIVYLLACRFGGKLPTIRSIIQKIVRTPILWAIGIGILWNYTHMPTPELLMGICEEAGKGIILAAMIAVGLELELPQRAEIRKILALISVKTMIGFVIAFVLSHLFNLSPFNQKIVLVTSVLPSSLGTFIFCKENDLDPGLASKIFSTGIMVAIILLPLMMLLL